MGWSKQRYEQHQSQFPPEERAERNRAAQAAFRKRHAEKLRRARRVMNILVSDRWHHDTVKELAAGLRTFLTKDGVRDLRKELGRRRNARAFAAMAEAAE